MNHSITGKQLLRELAWAFVGSLLGLAIIVLLCGWQVLL